MAVHGDPRQEKHFDLKHQNGTNKEIFFLLKSVQFNDFVGGNEQSSVSDIFIKSSINYFVESRKYIYFEILFTCFYHFTYPTW